MALWTNTLERVLSFVEIVGEHCCWQLQGRVPLNTGYVNVSVHGARFLAHRFVYERLIGRIPAGLTLDHICTNRWCCNPNHVEPVTRGVNTMRGNTITAANAAKSHCKLGHPLSGVNLYKRPGGGRECITCRRQAVRRYEGRSSV